MNWVCRQAMVGGLTKENANSHLPCQYSNKIYLNKTKSTSSKVQVHASTDKPARCSHTSKTEVLLSRTSCGVQNNTDDNSVIYCEYTDHNKDLEIPLLPRNEHMYFH